MNPYTVTVRLIRPVEAGQLIRIGIECSAFLECPYPDIAQMLEDLK